MTCPTCGTVAAAPVDECPSCGTSLTPLPTGETTLSPTHVATTSPAHLATRSATQRATLSATQVPTIGLTESQTGAATAQPMPTDRSGRFASPSPLQVGEQFGPRYRILRLLGVGGMGAVYQAWDEELAMAVALKVIRRDQTVGTAATESERRFKRELVLARQVTHKNVIRIHDLGEVHRTKYISMPFVEGEDLARFISRNGKLPIAQALQFARQIASGLRAAHEVGVVHRDLKPANILIGPDGALITDFGIAHSLSAGGEGAADRVGTIRYMAPEQAQGLPVDHRADIYAFGLILYEMLTGRGWTTGTNTLDVLGQKVAALPAVELVVEAEFPDAVAVIVKKCVQPNAADRYATVAELLADLEGLDDAGHPLPRARVFEIPRFVPFVGGSAVARSTALAVLALCVAVPIASALAFFGGSSLSSGTPIEHEPVTVLVADFENRTGQPVFDGLIEQSLGVALEGAPFITAYPRSDARRVAQQIANGDRLDVERARIVAQREGIKVVLAGSIAAEGSRYRVTVRAVDPVPGTTLSTLTETASSRDEVLNAVGELGSELRTALGDTTPTTARLSERETFTAASVEAASVYWQAQELLNNGKYAESIPYFQRATELDPSFARAYASWAVSAYYLGRRDETETLYKRAFALSDRMSEREKYRTYGTYYLTVAQAYQEAIKNYERLVQLYPADRAAHGNLAVAYFYVLNFAKAFEEGRRALDLYPASPKLRNNVALYAMYAGDFETAAREAEQVLKVDPQYFRAYVPLAIAAIDRSPEDARAAYQKMAAINSQGASLAAVGLADLALYQARDGDAVTILELALAADEKTGNRTGVAGKSIALAETYAQQGRPRQALGSVGRALQASRQDAIMLGAARVLLSLGRRGEAGAIATELSRKTEGYSRTYGRLIGAELALLRGDAAEAVNTLRAGEEIADLWLLHFVLGQAYVEAERYPEALAEFEACLKRRGEASAVFLDDMPSFRYLAPLPYWLARAQEGVGLRQQATENYRQFLAPRPARSDHITRDARQRLAKLSS